MSVLVSVGIILLAVLIMSFLTLSSGAYALFCHYAYGRFSRKRASEYTFLFILGTEITSSCIFLSTYTLVAVVIADLSHLGIDIITWFLTGIMFALSIVSLFFYYHRGEGTRLFIPRKIANSINYHAKTAKARSDAFVLGALCSTPELIFTLPLFVITSGEILQLSISHPSNSLLTIIYIVVPIIPLLITRWLYHKKHNLAVIQRSRVHNKNFTKFILCTSYLLIAILLICFRI